MASLRTAFPLIFLLMILESAQCCRVSAGVREERGEAVSYSNSECLMGSRLWNQIFPASCVSGASGTEWSVTYNQQEICALEGSTVFMKATYTRPANLTVIETFWSIDPDEKPDLSKNTDFSGRVEYSTDEQKHFSLRLSDVNKKDEHLYGFRIITNVEKQRWMGNPGVQLRVTDLQVEAPGEVTEGETAVLTCNTTCSLTDPTFTWYKNGRPLTTKTNKNNQLHLQPVSSEDAGSYSCAVGGYQQLRSTDQTLRVRYPPKNVSVSISPSDETVESGSETLTCSSDANPPVKMYIWYKEGVTLPVGSGDSYSPVQSGSYYCKAWNEHGDQRSDPVPVVVKAGYSVILYVSAGVGLCVVVGFLSVFFWRRRKSQTTNTNEPGSAKAGVGAPPPGDDSCSANIYMNVLKGSLSAPPPDNDTTSVDDYEDIQSAALPDDDSFSDDDYQNIATWKNH